MKINLIELIKTGDIKPFKWNDSEKDFIKIFPEWEIKFENSRKANYPYFEINGIEFYFDKDNYKELSEIVIKVWTFDRDYKSDFFEIGWLRNDLTFSNICEILNTKKWQFELTKAPHFNTPIILPNRKVLFGFESFAKEEFNKEEAELQKIFIRKEN